MNTEQAIKAVEKGYVAVGDALYIPDGNTALKHIILTALCEKQERDNPMPLTLEQLKERVGMPVWIVVTDPSVYSDGWSNSWGFVRKSVVRTWIQCDLITFDYHFEDYGKTWLAYDHEPKEVHDGRFRRG